MAQTELEPMSDFFAARLEGYDRHMLSDIEGSAEFYPYTASLLPDSGRILDLGCGTGLELDYYYSLGGKADVTGIDLCSGMLAKLRAKHPDKKLTLICASYFDLPLGKEEYDAAVSVESLHHFVFDDKLALYKKLRLSLKEDGYFILTDYFCDTEERQSYFRSEYERMKREQNLSPDIFYHYDTPLTVGNETSCLKRAGFSSVSVLNRWENTYTIKAVK